MPEAPDISEILRANPHLDASELQERQRYFHEVRRRQGGRKGYGLAAPHERHRVTTGGRDETDPRTVDLSSRRQPGGEC